MVCLPRHNIVTRSPAIKWPLKPPFSTEVRRPSRPCPPHARSHLGLQAVEPFSPALSE